MTPKPLNFLRKLRLSEVSFVPQGANPHAHVMIAKEDVDKDFHGMTSNDLREKLTSDLREIEGGGDDEHCWLSDFDDTMVVYESSDGLFQRAYTFAADGEITFNEPTEVTRQTSYVAKEPLMSEDATPTAEELQTQLDALNQEKADREAELETARTELETTQAELEKAKAEGGSTEEGEPADPEIRKELDDAKAALDATNAELVELQKERRTERFAKEAEGYAPLGPPEKVASLLDAADEHFEEGQQETLKALLKGASEQISKGDLFGQFSQPASGENGTWEDRLLEKARDLVAKGEADTIEQAKVKVMKSDPEIRKEREESVRS